MNTRYRITVAALLTILSFLCPFGIAESFAQAQWMDSKTNYGFSSSILVAKPDNVTIGDLVVVTIAYQGGTGAGISPPGGWQLVRRDDSGTNVGIATYYRIATFSDALLVNYNFTGSGMSSWSIGASRFVGFDPSSPIEAHAGATYGASATFDAPSIDVAENTLVMAMFTNLSAATFTPPGGTTERYDEPNTGNGMPSNMMATYLHAGPGTATGARTATPSATAAAAAHQIGIRSLPPPPPPPAVVQSSTAATGSGSVATVTKPTGVVAGDLLVMGVMFSGGSDVSTITSSGWTLVRRDNTGNQLGMATLYRVATFADAQGGDYTILLGGNVDWALGVTHITGADTRDPDGLDGPLLPSPIEAHAGATVNEATPFFYAPSVNASEQSLVLAFFTNRTDGTYNIGYPEAYDEPNTASGLPSNMMAYYTHEGPSGETGLQLAFVSEQAVSVAQQLVIKSGPVPPGPTEPPSELSYNTPNTFTYGTPISALVPTVTGTVESYSVSPALPAGLTLDETTGEISGTPTDVAATETYTVTATNALGSTTFDLEITVEPKALTVSGVTALDKVYDGNTDAELDITGATLDGVVGSDDVSLESPATGTFDQSDVGVDIPVTAALSLTGDDAYKYTLTQPTGLAADISALSLSVEGVVALDKVYDGTTAAVLDIGAAVLVGVVPGDEEDVWLANPVGEFASPDIGTDIPVTSLLTLEGDKAGNYTLTQPTGLTADILSNVVTIGGYFEAKDKPYDGTTLAKMKRNELTLIGVQEGDDVHLQINRLDFDSANDPQEQPVRITEAELVGEDAHKYALSLEGAPVAMARIIMFQISGFVFEDRNGNGTRDEGEPGIEGWTLTAQTSGNTYETATDANGYYEFNDIVKGLYSIRGQQPEGWTQSTPGGEGFHIVNVVPASTIANADFGFWKHSAASGKVYVDANGNGMHDAGESVRPGEEVRLFNLRNEWLATATTDPDGNFTFDALAPGHFSIRLTAPDGYQVLNPAEGYHLLTVTSGSESADRDFGIYQPAHLAGNLHIEPPLEGPFDWDEITIQGYRAPNVSKVAEDPTEAPLFSGSVNPDGSFQFDGLAPGAYKIVALTPDFLTVTSPNPVWVELVSGGTAEIHFDLFYDNSAAPETATSSISGSVYSDGNGSGSWQSATESGLSGRTVSLRGKSRRGATIERTITTANDGSYTFAGLPAGRYHVSTGTGSGYSAIWPHAGEWTVDLGTDQHVGHAPQAHSTVAQAAGGMHAAFATLTLAIDDDFDGLADRRIDLSGSSEWTLAGVPGMADRMLEMMFSGVGVGDGTSLVFGSTPGIQRGELASDGSLSVNLGLSFDLRGGTVYTEMPVALSAMTTAWPNWHVRLKMSSAPVMLRDPFGAMVAQLVHAELLPMYGVDLSLQYADYGDAPASYGTLAAAKGDRFTVVDGGLVYPMDGARHLLPGSGTGSPRLGATVSADTAGMPSSQADADNDDGVTVGSAAAPSGTMPLSIAVSGTGYINAWADWNRNGTFDGNEQIITAFQAVGSEGPFAFEIPVPSNAQEGLTFIRFRIASASNLGPTGMAADGEVEDYAIQIDANMAGNGSGLPTSSHDEGLDVPVNFALGQNYPNPFNPTTAIPYELAADSRVILSVFDVTGRKVATVVDADQRAGRHTATFNAAGLPSGVYIVRLEAGGNVFSSKFTLMK